jgi:hypothetical protein
MSRFVLSLVAIAAAVGASPAAARPVEGYHTPDGRIGCVMYPGFNADGNAVKCGRHGSARGLLLPSAGPARKMAWSWPAKSLGSLFFTAPLNRKLYFYGGTAKLVGDDSILRCTFSKAKVVCRNGDGYGLTVTRGSTRAIAAG